MLTAGHVVKLIVLGTLLSLSTMALELRWVPEGREIDKLAFRADVYLEREMHKEAEPCFKEIFRSTKLMQNKASALYGQAVCLRYLGKYEKAANRFKLAAASYGNYVPYEDALAATFEIAYEKFENRRWFFGLFSRQSTAIKLYDYLHKAAPYSRTAPLAMYRRALIALKDEDDRPRGIHLLDLFLTRYRTHKLAPAVRTRLIAVLLEDADRSQSDDKLLRRVRHQADILRRNDTDAKLEKEITGFLEHADTIESEHLHFLGRFYQQPVTHRPRAARRYLDTLVQRFPSSPLKAQAELLLSGVPKLEPLPFADREAKKDVDKPKKVDTDPKPWAGGPSK